MGFILWRERILLVFLKLQLARVVYSRVTTGMNLQARVCSATSGVLSSYEGHLRYLLEAWQGNTDASRGEARDTVSLYSCHSYIGIPINFQEESGIVTF